MKTPEFQTSLRSKKQWLISELQSAGLRIEEAPHTAPSRVGGAGPTDHKSVTVLGTTIMVPVHTRGASTSPYSVSAPGPNGDAYLYQEGSRIGSVEFPGEPAFYGLETSDGIPYWKIAQLHSRKVLATTVLQTCIRYGDSSTKCQFCAIGESLKAGRTIREKTPEQLAEVAEAAKRLDGIDNVVMTTGTPPGSDRGAAVCDGRSGACTSTWGTLWGAGGAEESRAARVSHRGRGERFGNRGASGFALVGA